MNVTVLVSRPANNSTFFAVGERPVVTVMLMDKAGKGLSMNDFTTLDLYMFGPQEMSKTVTAVKLLNASENRSASTHHYIHLIGNNATRVSGPGGMQLDYTLQPITTELPGTYTVALRVAKKSTTFKRENTAFVLRNTQIGTATVEQQTVAASKCGSCHLGGNGQYYLHHTDPYRNLTGSPEIDSMPIATCKVCHNNNGYASFVRSTGERVVDDIIIRVHGVHMGEELKNPLNIDHTTGNFRFYAGVIFPQNPKNCLACHTNDNWKTKPSIKACGTCHDSTWFGNQAAVPAGYKTHDGGAQADDTKCNVCHTIDTIRTSELLAPIPVVHQISQPMNKVDVVMTPPANGNYYVAGEKPVVTLVVRNDNGTAIDHTTLNTAFTTANLYVYGPRANTKAVLTNTAINGNTKVRASVTSTIAGPWTFVAGDTFKISVSDGPIMTIAAPVGTQTANQTAAWLLGALGANVTVTGTAANQVNLQHLLFGDASKFAIYNSAVTTKMGWKPGPQNITREGIVIGMTKGTTMEPYVVQANVGTPAVNLRTVTAPNYNDPNITRTQANISYQLLDTTGLKPGTYFIYTYTIPTGVTAGSATDRGLKATAAAKAANNSRQGIGFMTFQVGTATVDRKVATNCADCHGANIWHLDVGPIHAEPFDTDYCNACHDYGISGVGTGYSRMGGTSTSGWAGYGTKPISARIHGVHFGNYLNRPEEVYAGTPGLFAAAIFPQDVRNCEKCHSAATTGTWKTEPSRLACMSCHDSDAALAHGQLNAYDPTPNAPDSKDELESCKTCHGAGKEFAPEVVHNISNPYVTPYPREGQAGNTNAVPSWKIGQ